MKKLTKFLGLVTAFAVLAVLPTMGVIVVDEFGNSNFQPGFQGPDPTGGFLGGPVLIYNLPFAGTPGDVLLHEGALNQPFLDVIRFDGHGHLIFYSDNVGGADSPADTSAPPNPLFPNQVNLLELGPEGGFQYADYAPAVGQPGYDPSNDGYRFISDVAVPEPSTYAAGALLLLPLAFGAFRKLRKGQKAA